MYIVLQTATGCNIGNYMADFERNDMEKNNLSVKIFDFVREHDGCAAKQIAEALGITKTAVNKILYGSDCCYIDNLYCWHIKGHTDHPEFSYHQQSETYSILPPTSACLLCKLLGITFS